MLERTPGRKILLKLGVTSRTLGSKRRLVLPGRSDAPRRNGPISVGDVIVAAGMEWDDEPLATVVSD